MSKPLTVTQAILTLGLSFLFLTSAHGAEPKSAPKRILFIGNSYTAGIKQGIEVFLSSRSDIHLRFITPGGRTLIQHAENETTLREIADGKWDIVVLQEQSQTLALPPLAKAFFDGGRRLHAVIKKSGAKTMLFQTWGRRDGDSANAKINPDFETMQTRLCESYAALGKEIGADVVSVGEAWRRLKQKSPDLWKKLYAPDGSHPSRLGAYLTGAVFMDAMFQQSRAKNLKTMRGVSVNDAKRLLEAAKAKANE